MSERVRERARERQETVGERQETARDERHRETRESLERRETVEYLGF